MFRRCFRCFCWWCGFKSSLIFHPYFGEGFQLDLRIIFRMGWLKRPTSFFWFSPALKIPNLGMGPMGLSFPPKGSSLGFFERRLSSHSHSCPRIFFRSIDLVEWTGCVCIYIYICCDIYNNTHIYICIYRIYMYVYTSVFPIEHIDFHCPVCLPRE